MSTLLLFFKQRHSYSLILVMCLLTLCLSSCDSALNEPSQQSLHKEEIIPEVASAIGELKLAKGQQFMAVTANPHATDAAYQMLKKGGSAVDAAIAAQLVLGLVEPQSSGIGGGGFMLSWQSKGQTLQYYDGRETAPAAVDESLFLTDDGKAMPFLDAAIGGRSVGVPGLLRMLEMAHQREGKLSWAELFTPAISLAQEGFLISQRLHTMLSNTSKIKARSAISQYFFTADGSPLPVGYRLKNMAYANTLKAIANNGSDVFYRGDMAKAIVNAVNNDPLAGQLSLNDMANYQPKIRQALCHNYLQYNVCTTAPPAAGVTVLQILGILEQFDLNNIPMNSAQMAHLFSEASNLAFADRNTYVADADFVAVPIKQLLAPVYLQQRAALIHQDRHLGKALPGKLQGNKPSAFSYADSPELMSTTHFSIVDSEGNAVSMTSSIENAFGSRIFVNGFLLNNQLTDFSFTAKNRDGKLIANRVQAGKRPRSSMSPLIVFENNTPRLLIGSPGGSRIIDYNARAIVAHLTKGLPIEKAVAVPHIVNLNYGIELEENRFSQTEIDKLTAIGYKIKYRPQTSGLHGIAITKEGLHGGADPRREGVAKGQ